MNQPLPIPPEILQEIANNEAERLSMTVEECCQWGNGCGAYFPNYSTDCPGYVGPVVVIVWPAGAEAVSTFTLTNGKWQHCNSSNW